MKAILGLSQKLNAALSRRKHLLDWFLVLFLSFVMFRTFSYMHGPCAAIVFDNTYGVLTGEPHWRAYSNRLLAPSIVYWISHLGISFQASLRIFSLLMIVAHNIILFLLLLQRTNKSYSISFKYMICFSFILVSMQRSWFYTWDYVDLIVFTVFAWAIFERRSLRFFVALFLIGILNRETGLFVPLYLLIDSFRSSPNGRRSHSPFSIILNNKARLIAGLSLLIGGSIYTKLIRDCLFVRSSVPDIGNDLAHRGIGNHIPLRQNIEFLLMENVGCRDVAIPLFMLGIIVYFAVNAAKLTERCFKTLVLFACILCCILVFGMVNETRVFVILIPFLIFFHMEFYDKRITVET